MIKVLRNYLYRITHSAWNIVFMILFVLITLWACSITVPLDYGDLSNLNRSLPDIRINEVMKDVADEGDLIPQGMSRQVWDDAVKNANGNIGGIFNISLLASVAACVFCFFLVSMNIKGDGVINMIVAGISRRKIYLGSLITSALIILITIAAAVGAFLLMERIYNVPSIVSIPFILRMLLILYLADLGLMALTLAFLFDLQKPILSGLLCCGIIIIIFVLTELGSMTASGLGHAEFLEVYDEYIEIYTSQTEEDAMKYMAAKERKEIIKDNKLYVILDGVEYEPNSRFENSNPHSEPWIFLHKVFVANGTLMPIEVYQMAGSGYSEWVYGVIDRHYMGWTIHCLLLTVISSTIGVELYRRRRN